MQTLSLRLFIVPLGAICTLAGLAIQDAPARAGRDTASLTIRQQVIDCSNKSPNEVCVIAFEGESNIR